MSVAQWEKLNGKLEDGIYFTPKSDNTTHYIAVINKKIKDPYNNFQFPNTHGFCQLFAFFLYINDINQFKKVNFSGVVTLNNFEKYTSNSYVCLQKLIKILKDKKYIKVKNAFKSDFNNLDEIEYDIKPGTSFTQFLNDLDKITLEQTVLILVDDVDSYIKTNKFTKQTIEKHKKMTTAIIKKWKSYKNNTNKQLHVLPGLYEFTTEDERRKYTESQFESYQSIIAYCFSADKNSPYYALLKEHNIKLIEKDISSLL